MLKKLRRRLAVIFTVFTGAVLGVALGISLGVAVENERLSGESMFYSQVDALTAQLLNRSAEDMAAESVVVEQGPFMLRVERNGEVLKVESAGSWEPDTDRDTLFTVARQTAEEGGYDVLMSQYTMGEPYDVAILAEDYAVDAAPAAEASPAQGHVAAFRQVEGGVTETDVDTAEAVEEAEAETGSAGVETEAVAEEATDAAAEEVFVAMVGVTQDYGGGVFTMPGEHGDEYRATHYTVHVQDEAAPGVDDDRYDVTLLEDLGLQKQRITLLCLGYGGLFLVGLGALFFINWMLAKLVLKPTAEGIQRQADFVAAASHELRSPLSVVRSSLSAEKAAETEAEADKFHQSAEIEAARMSRLVDDLLLLAGGDAGKWKLQKEEADLDTVLIEAGEAFAARAAKKRVDVRLDLPDDTLPRVYGDKDRLRQILHILLDNALQYAPEESVVTLAAARQKNRVAITVEDHGPGVEDALKERVFERFFRADESRADKSHFGLGLSVARELAALHEGTLRVRDTPGGGATFILQLPVKG